MPFVLYDGDPTDNANKVGEYTFENGQVILRHEGASETVTLDGDGLTTAAVYTERVESDLPVQNPNIDARLHRSRGRRRDLTGTVFSRPSKPVVAFQIDGTRDSAYDLNDPYLDNNVRVGLAITTGRVGEPGYLTWDQIDELINEHDWTAMNHAVEHNNFQNLTEEEMREEVYGAHRELLDRGYEPTQYVYAGGNTGEDMGRGIVAELYDYAYGIEEFTFADSTAVSPYQLPRKATESQFNSTADLKAAIDTAKSNNVAVHFYTHEIIQGTEADEGPTETSTQKLRDVINYAQTEGVDIHAPDEALRWCAPQMPLGRGGLSKIQMRPGNGNIRTTLAADAVAAIRGENSGTIAAIAENGDWSFDPPERIFTNFSSGGEQWWRDSSNNLLMRILESGTLNIEDAGRLAINGEFDLVPKSSAPSNPSDGDMAYADGTNWDPGSGAGFYGYEEGSWVKL